mgnify:CR=1 FL=1
MAEENEVSIYKLSQPNKYMFYSSHQLFKERELITTVHEEYITIERPPFDFRGTTVKPQDNTKSIKRFFNIRCDREIQGKYEIDLDDSTEDELIINL